MVRKRFLVFITLMVLKFQGRHVETTQLHTSDPITPIQTYILKNSPDTPPTLPTSPLQNPISGRSTYLDKMTLKQTMQEMKEQPMTKRTKKQEEETTGDEGEKAPSTRTSTRRRGNRINTIRKKKIERKKGNKYTCGITWTGEYHESFCSCWLESRSSAGHRGQCFSLEQVLRSIAASLAERLHHSWQLSARTKKWKKEEETTRKLVEWRRKPRQLRQALGVSFLRFRVAITQFPFLFPCFRLVDCKTGNKCQG